MQENEEKSPHFPHAPMACNRGMQMPCLPPCAMTREGGTRKLGAAPLRMGKAPKFVIASLAEQGAAISQYWPEHGKASGGHGVFIR